MSQHTPGPWKIRQHDGLLVIDGALGFVCTLDQPSGPERQANARLIAAALDLLEALKGLCEADRDDLNDSVSAVWNAAVAAIAKAEGRS